MPRRLLALAAALALLASPLVDAQQPRWDDVVAKAYTLYEQRMAAANATDFGGLLLHALHMCLGDTPVAHQLRERFDHVLVDEFQDTNLAQW